MNTAVSWMLELTIKKDEYENFEALMVEMVKATQSGEPGTLVYEWFVNKETMSCHLYERYADSAAVMTHLGTFGRKYVGRFMKVLTPVRLTVYGSPDEQVRNALSGSRPVFFGFVGGFCR